MQTGDAIESADDAEASARPVALLALCGAAAWLWAGLTLTDRNHLTFRYQVEPADAPSLGAICVFGLMAFAFGRALWRAMAGTGAFSWRAPSGRVLGWLLATLPVPLLAWLRNLGILAVPVTFVDALWFVVATGAAAANLMRCQGDHHARWSDRLPWRGVLLATAALALWWFLDASQALADYQLGYPDFGMYARRVVNTWEGRGLLIQTPIMARFFDHFNPGLILLVPFWAIWSDVHVFLLIQALCLATPALLIYPIARRAGADRHGAACWALAFLLYPSVGQMNLNFSYGWHPVSVSIPFFLASVWAATARRWIWAAILMVVAGSFRESVFLDVGGLAFGLAVRAWLDSRSRQADAADKEPGVLLGVAWWKWLAVSVTAAISFFLIMRLSGLSKLHMSLFSDTGGGGGTGGLLLAPFTNPGEFWPRVLNMKTLCFLLALSAPVGFRPLRWGWPMLLGIAMPLGILIIWVSDGATMVGFQYSSMIIPVLFAAAVIGCAQIPAQLSRAREMRIYGAAAALAALAASTLFGALPWSGRTHYFQVRDQDRELWDPHVAVLNTVVEEIRAEPAAAVLASSRFAAHLLDVERLEAPIRALSNRDRLAAEAGPGKAWIETFDWVVLDLLDCGFTQGMADYREILRAVEAAGYTQVRAESSVLVFRAQAGKHMDPFAEWRVPADELRALRQETPNEVHPGVDSLTASIEQVQAPGAPPAFDVELVLQTTVDDLPNLTMVHSLRTADKQVVSVFKPRLYLDMHYPLAVWRKGEAFRLRYSVPVPPNHSADTLTHRFSLELAPNQ